MSRRRLRFAGLAAAVVLLSCGAGTSCANTPFGGPAARPSPPGSLEPDDAGATRPDTAHSPEVADRLDQVGDDIAQGREGEDIPGYAGEKVDVEAGILDVYWVGEPPEHVRQIAAAPPAGITVNVHPARYDLKAMIRAIEKVDDRYGDYVHSASPNVEGDGIVIGRAAVTGKEDPTDDEISAAAGMPVTMEIGEPAVPLPAEPTRTAVLNP